jgi:hypothetical protein
MRRQGLYTPALRRRACSDLTTGHTEVAGSVQGRATDRLLGSAEASPLAASRVLRPRKT